MSIKQVGLKQSESQLDKLAKKKLVLKDLLSTILFVVSLVVLVVVVVAFIGLYVNSLKRQKTVDSSADIPATASSEKVEENVDETDLMLDQNKEEAVVVLPDGTPKEAYLAQQRELFSSADREILMRGDVDLNGGVTFGSWNKKARERLENVIFQVGDYELHYLDGTGKVFNTIYMAEFYFLPGKHFEYFIPEINGMAKVILTTNKKVLAEKVISENTPVVLMQNTPVFDNDGNLSFNFTGTDGDGDVLTYSIFYSTDNWQTYENLVLDLSGSVYQTGKEKFTSGTTYQFKIYASDGFNTSYVKVDDIIVP